MMAVVCFVGFAASASCCRYVQCNVVAVVSVAITAFSIVCWFVLVVLVASGVGCVLLPLTLVVV